MSTFGTWFACTTTETKLFGTHALEAGKVFQSFLPSADAQTLRPRRTLPILDPVRANPRDWDTSLAGDLKTLARFLDVYCRCRHTSVTRKRADVPGFDVSAIARKEVTLCSDCTRLLTHAFVKRSRCPMNPKPACKNCTRHCYHPTFRNEIRKVMRFSGTRLLLTGRIDYIFHLLF